MYSWLQFFSTECNSKLYAQKKKVAYLQIIFCRGYLKYPKEMQRGNLKYRGTMLLDTLNISLVQTLLLAPCALQHNAQSPHSSPSSCIIVKEFPFTLLFVGLIPENGWSLWEFGLPRRVGSILRNQSNQKGKLWLSLSGSLGAFTRLTRV